MRTRRILSLCLFASLALATTLLPGLTSPSALAIDGQNTASESYYRLDVPNGTVTARVELTLQNAGHRDTTVGVLWAMPRAQNLVVYWDDDVLETKITPAFGQDEQPTIVEVTLPRTLKPDAQIDLVMTYDVPGQMSELVRMEPGATEAMFVSQGPGSFVFLDLPADAENVLDPGCLVGADQPGDVRSAGLERWVCGEVTLIALAADDPKTLERCANLDDRCRQRLDGSPFSAFVQSISDPSLQGVLQETVVLGGGEVRLELKYFKQEQAWAQKQFGVAKQALPQLEALFGFNYPYETLTMRQSHHLGSVGAAGVAFSGVGEVLLATDTGFDEEVTVHELAHQWSSRAKHFADSFISEGLAEWSARSLGSGLGYAPVVRDWQIYGFTDGLATWRRGSAVTNGDYWYGKSGAFWFEYEKTVGGRENMTRILSLIDDYEAEWPLDGGWFMDRGEEVSGANLDELFLSWVYNPVTAKPLLESRRAAHNAVGPLRLRVAELGWTGLPTDLQTNLDEWQFASVPTQVESATALLDDYAGLVAEMEAAGLPLIDNVKNAWNAGAMRDTAGVIVNQRNALRAIVNSTKVLENEEADSPSMKQLAEARQKWAEGDLAEANRLGAAAATTSFNEDAAVKMIALAREKEANFKAGFLGTLGLMWKDPAGELARAEEAYSAGDPTKAMELAQGAYNTWNTADRSGLMRLSFLMALMCVLSALVWWLLRRLDEPDLKLTVDPYAVKGGHNIGDPESRRPNWKDWENSNQ